MPGSSSPISRGLDDHTSAQSALPEHLCADGPQQPSGETDAGRCTGWAVRTRGPVGRGSWESLEHSGGDGCMLEGGPTEEELRLIQSPKVTLLSPVPHFSSHPTRHSLTETAQGGGDMGRHAALLAGGRAGTAVWLLAP